MALVLALVFAQGAPRQVTARMTPAVGTSPRYVLVGSAPHATTGTVFDCQVPGAPQPTCYGPQQIRNAYDVTPLLNRGDTGAGKTIVIIDAFQAPTIQSDLNAFDQTFGLPSPKLHIIAPFGLTPFDASNQDQLGWSGEISLDVQWAHAIAPGAAIDLVLSKSDSDQDILNASRYAILHHLGDVISQSFGEGESCMEPSIMSQQHQLFELATAEGVTIFASSGDDGAAQPDCNSDGGLFLSASTPASDPFVTGVGGTNLTANLTTGAYQSETAWNDGYGESGGGFSTVYSRPAWQTGASAGHARGVPDVAYNAGVDDGVLTYFSDGTPGVTSLYIFGGTSAGSPQWSGIIADTDQLAHRDVGLINPALYLVYHTPAYGRAFHDVTTGNNTVSGVGGYNTGRGWDPVTGLGTPQANNLAQLLAFGD
ncbi:MAG TPA: S53 family peptidase [Candidatus Dormibacteraeota bacterium]|nr:S53 family peptidase [Candidatus Dormibacteraeota bacterium]